MCKNRWESNISQTVCACVGISAYPCTQLASARWNEAQQGSLNRLETQKKTKEHLQHKEFHLSSLRRTICCNSPPHPLSLSLSAALQSIAGQKQGNKCALRTCVCLSVCLPFLQPKITYQNVFLAAQQKRKMEKEKNNSSPRYGGQIWLPKKGIINCLQCVPLLKTHLKWIKTVRRGNVQKMSDGGHELK